MGTESEVKMYLINPFSSANGTPLKGNLRFNEACEQHTSTAEKAHGTGRRKKKEKKLLS